LIFLSVAIRKSLPCEILALRGGHKVAYFTGVNKLHSLRSLIYKQKALDALKTIYNIKQPFAN